jgi:hypothetical protein
MRVNITRGSRKHAAAPPEDGEVSGRPGRRSVLGGLVAVPVMSGLAMAAGPVSAALAAQPGKVLTDTDDLVRGEERRYNAPLLTPGTRLVLPAGVKAVPVLDAGQRPSCSSTANSAGPMRSLPTRRWGRCLTWIAASRSSPARAPPRSAEGPDGRDARERQCVQSGGSSPGLPSPRSSSTTFPTSPRRRRANRPGQRIRDVTCRGALMRSCRCVRAAVPAGSGGVRSRPSGRWSPWTCQ